MEYVVATPVAGFLIGWFGYDVVKAIIARMSK
jgi:hypothetical protein